MPAPESGEESSRGDARRRRPRRSTRTQNRNRKRDDPFWELSDDALQQATQPSATPSPCPSPRGLRRADTLLAHLITTPIRILGFFLSLAVVERRHRQWRLSNHAPPPPAAQNGWFANPEPYQEAGGSWHPRLSWKRRRVAEIQLGQVLEMRGRVILGITVCMALGIWACAWAARSAFCWAFA